MVRLNTIPRLVDEMRSGFSSGTGRGCRKIAGGNLFGTLFYAVTEEGRQQKGEEHYQGGKGWTPSATSEPSCARPGSPPKFKTRKALMVVTARPENARADGAADFGG